MKRFLIATGLMCVVSMAGVSSAQTPPAGQPTAKPGAAGSQAATGAVAAADRTFAMHAAQGGMAEVEMGKLAAANAASPDVKQFGQRMVDDHGKANDELKSWASKSNVTLAAELDAKHKADQAKMAKLSGAAFDRAYMTMMVADHDKDVKEFQQASRTAKDADLKAWVVKTLPTLQEHQKMAHDISAKVTGGATTPKPGAGVKE
jgi:putative membrane protein